MNVLISFSGGRSSALMAKLVKEHHKDDNILVVFANTGKEREETLNFVDMCDDQFNLNVVWIEADVNQEKGIGTTYKQVQFPTASRNGEPFEAIISKLGLPNKSFRHCTRDLKEIPIHKYAKWYFEGEDYLTAIGIRADEKHRISQDKKKIYPLADFGINEEFVRTWWSRQEFDLELKDYEGNCDLCFLKSIRKKLTLIKENPKSADWWGEMEDKYRTDKLPRFDVYRKMTIQDFIEKSKIPFRMVQDLHELRSEQSALFEFDIDIDLEFDCFCKSN